jgi:hypothetical protein
MGYRDHVTWQRAVFQASDSEQSNDPIRIFSTVDGLNMAEYNKCFRLLILYR